MATQAVSTKKTKVITVEPGDRPLKQIFGERDIYARRGDIELIGSLLFVFCEQGVMEFARVGPMLATLTDGPQKGAYVLLQEWQGLPPLVKLTDERCEACLAECVECHGKKEVRCGHKGCGGAGVITTGYKACPECEKRGKIDSECACGGAGRIPSEQFTCPNCKGSKVEPCHRCNATGQMSTGKIDGKTCNCVGFCEHICPACLGNQRRVEFREQGIKKFSCGELEGYEVLGPIGSLTLLAPPNAEGVGILSLECMADFEGNFPVLMTGRGRDGKSRAYLHGGIIRRAQ